MSLDFSSDLKARLEELRNYFQNLATYANSQLTNVEALLDLSMPAIPIAISQSSAIALITPKVEKLPETSSADFIEEVKEMAIAPSTRKKSQSKNSQSKESVQQAVTKLTEEIKSRPTAQKTKNSTSKKVKSATKPRPSEFLTCQPEYVGKPLLTALGEILEGHRGEPMDIDMVTKELHVELPLDLYKLARERVGKLLSKGKTTRQWDAVPGKIGFYVKR